MYLFVYLFFDAQCPLCSNRTRMHVSVLIYYQRPLALLLSLCYYNNNFYDYYYNNYVLIVAVV